MRLAHEAGMRKEPAPRPTPEPAPDARLRRTAATLLASLASALLGACASKEVPDIRDTTPASAAIRVCDPAAARTVVELLGQQLQHVSLLAPDSAVARDMRESYAPLVTPELLRTWLADPPHAPGRQLSSPWPERIDVRAVQAAEDGACRVTGDVVYVTSAERGTDRAARIEPVVVRVTQNPDWRISAYEAAPVAPADAPRADSGLDAVSDAAAAVDVVRRYYAAIGAGDYPHAYAFWSRHGEASGKTLRQFAAGFDSTARVSVEIGTPSRVEAAAGSRYITIPVVVRSVATSGAPHRFDGDYVLRRSVVDGASAEQRQWRFSSARLAPAGVTDANRR
jgi:hypothetical protein